MEKVYFSVNGVEYAIQTQPGKNYKEIIEKATGRRVTNQKQVCRDYGIDVSTDAGIMNTHQAINELIKRIKNKKDNHTPQVKRMNSPTVFGTPGQKNVEQRLIEKILTLNGSRYVFTETYLHFEGENYRDVFAGKNNKTLLETVGEEKYRHLGDEARTRYSGCLNKELGLFLKQLKDNGDMFYKRFLNEYGDATYSRFYMTDASLMAEKGLYLYCVNDGLTYIGRSKDPFGNRINNGYCRISPKNCFLDGQSTNCHLNSLITTHREHIHLLLLPLRDDSLIENLEKGLIKEYAPPWNIRK